MALFSRLLAMDPKAPPPLVFVEEDGKDAVAYTPGELLARARSVAGFLQKQEKLVPGDRVALVYPPGMEFVVGFVACVLAGLIPVPVYPPRPAALGVDLPKVVRVTSACDAKVALTTRKFRWAMRLGSARDLLMLRGASKSQLKWVTTDELSPDLYALRAVPTPAPDDVAFLQFTSGSTGDPKGVMITHRNLEHQLAMNASVLGMGADARLVAWVPQYHDLGLISAMLSVLSGNGRLWFTSPLAFLRDPGIWFDLATRVKATHTAAPNFGYELVVRKTTPERRAKWDLSTLKVAMSAGEPVRAATLDRFLEAMRPVGFHPDAFCPAYGLAEHTVGVTIGGRKRLTLDRAALRLGDVAEHKDGVELVGNGPVGPGVHVRIVDADALVPVAPGRIGEIWARSDSRAIGYWGRPEQSKDAFEATLPDDPGPWLRTGDLGFLHEGELFVTGRLRDLIIVRGRNVFPEDLEEEARVAHPDIRAGGLAGFAIPGPQGEEIALLVETKDAGLSNERLDAIGNAVIERIRKAHGVSVGAVGVGAPGLVKKTTSGKVMRSACRQAWLDETLKVRIVRGPAAAAVEPGALDELKAALAEATGAERKIILEGALIELATQHLKLAKPPAADTPLDELGIDSMQAVELAEELALITGREVSPRTLLEAPDLHAIAELLAES